MTHAISRVTLENAHLWVGVFYLINKTETYVGESLLILLGYGQFTFNIYKSSALSNQM